jgi:hypothetical protein
MSKKIELRPLISGFDFALLEVRNLCVASRLLGIYMLVYSVHFLFITRSCWIIKRKWTTYLLNIFFCLIVDRQKSSILALFVAIITFVREYFPTISTTLHWPIQLQPIYLHHFFFVFWNHYVSSQEHYFLLVECG